MSSLAQGVDPERRFAAQTVHRQSQGLHSNHIVQHQHPLPSGLPFPAHSHSPSDSMIGPTAPAAPYDPNVYPSYPPAERHQQDYENFIMTQLSAPMTNPSALSALPGGTANTIGRPPQPVYSDNTIERMVQRDSYATPYAAPSTTNPQAFLGGGGYPMQNQNPYAATNGTHYPNSTTAYPGTQAPMYTYDANLLLSPDSIHSIESPPMMMHQGTTRAHTIPYYSSVNRTNASPEMEVPFSQIVARNNSNSPQNTWATSGSPPNPNYVNTGHFPVVRSTPAKSASMAQQMQADAPQMQQHGLSQSQGMQSRLPNGGLPQPDGRAVTAPSGSQFVMNPSQVAPENIPRRKMAAAVSRRDPQQRLTNPQAAPSKQLPQPDPSTDAGKRTGANAPATAQGGGASKRVRKDVGSDSSSSEAQLGQNHPGRLPGACAPCKKLKMKCLFNKGEDACQRCRNSGRAHLCIVGPRKPRQPSNKKDMLLQKLKEKDAVIESLFKQLHNPHLVTPLQLDFARISPSLSSKDDQQLDPHIVEWIEKAQDSIKHNGGTSIGGYRVFGGDETSSDESDGNDLTSPKYGFKRTSQISSGSAEQQQSSDRSSFSGQLGVKGEGGPTLSRRASSTKLHSLPMDTTPIGMLADLSLKETEGKRSRAASAIDNGEIPQPDPEEDNELGVARKDYFQPGPVAHLGLRKILIERRNVPEIMTTGLISPAEVDKLFDIFFKKMNLFVSILDEAIHTPATTFGRCPFLFTVVCAISSRFYTERPELYSIAMHFAKSAAANALIDGWKSVEVCQAYILMSVYSLPSRKWEEAREWLYLGLAIRMATDLNLHLPSTTKVVNEQHERELLNRTRTWLICHNLDRSTSAQLGKPFTIQDDWIIRNSKEWWRRSKFNHPYDLHLVAYTDMLRNIMANFQKMVYSDPNSGNSLNKNLNFKDIAFNFDDQLQAWKSECAVRFATHSDPTSPQCAYRVQLLPFYVNYSRLVILSFAFHSGVLKHQSPGQDVVMRCLDAASSVIKVIVEVHAKTEYLRYAPDGHFVFVSFASAFLIKMLRKDPVPLLDEEQCQRVIELIERLIETLRSKQVAVDERHAPMLYSRFLSNLLARHKVVEEEPQPHPNSQRATPSTSGQQAPAAAEAVPASPSIEIVPPQPDRSDADMQGYDNDFGVGVFDPSPHPLSHQQQHSQEPHAQDQTFSMLNTFPAASFDSSNLSAATSTVHPESTVHGSQYDESMAIAADDFMLAPMYAVDNPGFWDHGMMPGFSWGPINIPWEMQIDPQQYDAMHMGGTQQ